MGGFCPITGTERCDKLRHEFILRHLRQGHSQQFKLNWRWGLADVMNETGITRGNCSGPNVGQTSGVPVHEVSDSVSIGSPENRSRDPANRQTGGLAHT